MNLNSLDFLLVIKQQRRDNFVYNYYFYIPQLHNENIIKFPKFWAFPYLYCDLMCRKMTQFNSIKRILELTAKLFIALKIIPLCENKLCQIVSVSQLEDIFKKLSFYISYYIFLPIGP